MTRDMQLTGLALLISFASACVSVDPLSPPPSPPTLSGPGPFIVSNAVASGPVGGGLFQEIVAGPVAFVSLAPGTLPEGIGVSIRVLRLSVMVSVPLVDGGMDPVAVPAVEGDTLSLTWFGLGGAGSEFRFMVPGRKPPVVVRTAPPKGKRDVPLNLRIEVVFSEPIDSASLTPQNFELRSGSGPVTGQLRFTDGYHTRVEFIPDANLAPATEYQLALGASIRDSEGTPLEAPVTVSFFTTASPLGETGLGAVQGLYRGSGGWYPAQGNGLPSDSAAWWPVLSITPVGPGQPPQYVWSPERGAFEFQGMAAGTWQLIFSGMHPWPGVFPDMRLHADTVIAVTVRPNQTVVLPEIVLRPVDTFMVIATEVCPWGFGAPPSVQDWGDCDSGYWGGIDVSVEVRGIAGTATAGISYSRFIPKQEWFIELRNIPLGEYEVSVAPLDGKWRLLPWQSPTARLRVDRGLAFVEFDYWYQR